MSLHDMTVRPRLVGVAIGCGLLQLGIAVLTVRHTPQHLTDSPPSREDDDNAKRTCMLYQVVPADCHSKYLQPTNNRHPNFHR
eukprot:m.968 g.968  ORF g.968 m.968 type:complete len:83 (+) comp571_c0_seq1:254-502(+)